MKKRVPTEKEIAKKHGVSVDYVTRQAEVGSTVEREHVTTHDEAYNIALQHIAEFPDYYKHLLKMEKKLKGEWRNGKKAVKEEKEETRYCHLCEKEETKSECSYGPSAWEMNSRKILTMKEDHKEIASGKIKDHEGYMANLELDQMERSIAMLRKVIRKSDQQLPAWVQSKITRAADFVDTAAEYLSSDEGLDEGLMRRLIDKAKGRKEVGRTASGGRIYQPTRPKKSTVKYQEKPKPATAKKSSGEDPWLQGARASGGAELKAHYRQLRGESKTYSQFMSEASFEIGPAHNAARRQAKIRNLADKTTSAGEKEAAERKIKGPTYQKPKQQKNVYIPRSGTQLNTEGAAWTKKSGKSPSGGLNEKGRKSYERENPGSDLKPPQPEGGPRKKSFCARMGGNPGPMKDEKGRPTRKALALRKWKC